MQIVNVVFVLLVISCALDVHVSANFRTFWIKLWTPNDQGLKWEDNCDRNCRAVCIEQFNNGDYSIGSVCNKDGWCVCKKNDSFHVTATALLSSVCLCLLYKFYYW
ncbi:uncharacterized protein LOC107044198 [Diachasma alloeum]|uniref:uncharacterized protein LOC107044198 n=1 Tax=Diachasma alloeum TaxID=454923 RepID=UPI0007381C29|nr:uncharacterized protein LOC107044198 [Diachasma alloeum]